MSDKIDKWISGIQAVGFVALGLASLYFVTLPQSQWQKESDAAKNKGEALRLLVETAKLPESDNSGSLKNLALEYYREQIELQARAGYVTKKPAWTYEGSSYTYEPGAFGYSDYPLDRKGTWASDFIDCARTAANVAKFISRKSELELALNLEVTGRETTRISGYGPIAAKIQADINAIQKLIDFETKATSEQCKTAAPSSQNR